MSKTHAILLISKNILQFRMYIIPCLGKMYRVRRFMSKMHPILLISKNILQFRVYVIPCLAKMYSVRRFISKTYKRRKSCYHFSVLFFAKRLEVIFCNVTMKLTHTRQSRTTLYHTYFFHFNHIYSPIHVPLIISFNSGLQTGV